MMPLKSLLAAIMFAATVSSAVAAQSVTKAAGGSIKTDLGYGMLNEKSSLTREWITVHDSSLPADISGTAGVEPVSVIGKRHYQYLTAYSIKTREAITAIEVRILIFDIWGDHSTNLSATEIIDMEAGATEEFVTKWNVYSANEVSEYYASIAYIAQVRTEGGKVIKADPRVVLEEARKFSKKFAEGDLELKPEKQ